jgi:hypothetical protein
MLSHILNVILGCRQTESDDTNARLPARARIFA